MKRFISLVICFILAFGTLPAFAEDVVVTYSNEDIVKEVAYAYYYQGGQIHYDQNRRFNNAAPEDATAQKLIYVDCSAFANSCYYQAFGVNVMPFERSEMSSVTRAFTEYARENQDSPDVVGYWSTADYKTEEEKLALMEKVKGMLQVGDVLVYTREKDLSGHTLIYVGDDIFLHATGNSGTMNRLSVKAPLSYENTVNEEILGAILKAHVDEVFKNKDSARYLFTETAGKKVLGFCVLRPLARNLTPTENALKRMKIQGLSMEKVCSVAGNNAVNTGDVLTYTIKLDNYSDKDINAVEFEDIVNPGTEFVSGSEAVKCENEKISWKGNVPAGKSVVLRYSVRITETVPGTILVNDSSYVGGIKLAKITHTLSTFDEDDMSRFKKYAKTFIGKSVETPMLFIDEIYGKTLGVNIFSKYTTIGDALENALSNHINNIELDGERVKTDTELSRILVPALYGGYDITRTSSILESIDQNRLLSEEELAVGDVILANVYSKALGEGNLLHERIYVYLGNSTLLTIEDNVVKTLNIGLDVYGSDADQILVALPAYSKYAVLRPSMATWNDELGFADVSRSDWFYPYVNFATSRYLIDGKGSSFLPEENLTRAELVDALYKMEGAPKVTEKITFEDVDNSESYRNAVIWANENNIVNGVTETKFSPESHITREQLATIIYRYADYKNVGFAETEDDKFSAFTDSSNISDYAKDGVLFAIEEGIISGFDDSTIRPQGNTTRAQAAAIINRISVKFGCVNIKEDYKIAILNAQKFLQDVNEYEYDENFINEFKSVCEKITEAAQSATPSELGTYTDELNKYLKKSIYYQYVSFESIDVVGKSWTHANGGQVLENEDGSVTFVPAEGQNSYSMTDVNTKNSVLTYKMKYDKLPTDKWRGVYFKMNSFSRGYNFIVKHNQIEFQNIDTTINVLPNFAIKGETWHTIDSGAVNTPTGVMQYLKIDGNVLFAKLDQHGAQTRTEGKIRVQYDENTHFDFVDIPNKTTLFDSVAESFNNPSCEEHLEALLIGANDFLEIDEKILANVDKKALAKELYPKVIAKEIQIGEDGKITEYKNAVLSLIR